MGGLGYIAPGAARPQEVRAQSYRRMRATQAASGSGLPSLSVGRLPRTVDAMGMATVRQDKDCLTDGEQISAGRSGRSGR